MSEQITNGAVMPAHREIGSLAPKEQDGGGEETRKGKKRFANTSENLSKFLLRVSNDIEHLDREKRLRLVRKGIRAHQYFDGNFYGYVDESCEWVDCTREEGEKWYSDDQYYPYLRTALMELSRTQTAVQINPASKSERGERLAKFAQFRYEANRSRTFTAHLKQTENTYALLNGIIFRYTFPNFSSGRKEKLPVTRQTQRTDGGESGESGQIVCADCAKPVPETTEINEFDERNEPCDHCGSTFTENVKQNNSPDVIIGYEDLKRCENQWISPNPGGIIVSMTASAIEETPFLKWKQLILRSVLEDKFPDVDFPTTGTSLELRYIANQQTSTPSGDSQTSEHTETGRTSESSDGRELELLEFQQVWLDYPVYAKWKSAKDQVLANGKTLAANTPLGEMFPEGLYFAQVGDLVVDMWNEDKNRKWTSSPYSLRPGSMYGAGTHSAHSDQESLNDLKRLKMANAYYNGVPSEFIDSERIPELSKDPARPTVVKNPDGQAILGYAYAQTPPVALGAEVYGLSDDMRSSMQNKVGALSSGSGGLADSAKWGDTATAISIRRDMSVGRFAPDLELMADNLDRKQAAQFLCNEQKYFTPEQWQEAKGDYDEETLKDFLSCEVFKDLIYTILPGSFMPKSEAQTQAKFSSFAESVGMIMQGGGNPEWISYAMEIYGIPARLGEWNSDRVKVDELIERFTLLSEEFVTQNGDAPDSDLQNPQILQAADLIGKYSQIPVDVFLDNHESIIDALKDWAQKDEGKRAPNVLKAAVALRLVRHTQAIALQPTLMQKFQQEAVAPIMQPEIDAQNAAQAQAEAQQNQQQQQEQGLMALDKVTELGDKERAREHEAEIQASDHQNQQQVAAIQAA